MKQEESVVYVVDDDPSLRGAIDSLLRSAGWRVQTFVSAQDFLDSKPQDRHACLVLDVALPGLSGLDLQSELIKKHVEVPVIFLTGHADIPMSVRAMKAGAVDFLTKPFRDQDMLDAVASAVEIHRSRRTHAPRLAALRTRHDRLSPREMQVMTLACAGKQNKQIAAQLGIQVITVKVHRSNVMKKMEASSLAELVRMAQILEPDGEDLYRGIGGP